MADDTRPKTKSVGPPSPGPSVEHPPDKTTLPHEESMKTLGHAMADDTRPKTESVGPPSPGPSVEYPPHKTTLLDEEFGVRSLPRRFREGIPMFHYMMQTMEDDTRPKTKSVGPPRLGPSVEHPPHKTTLLHEHLGVRSLPRRFREGDQRVDGTHFSKLKDSGLVQHVVLVSPALQQVHVIFDGRQREFCYTKLFKELESRNGLRLEHWEKQVTSSAKADSVTIVVFDNPDPVIDKKFVNAVGSTGTPDKGIIFLQNNLWGRRPDWVDARLPTTTLMVYPEFDRGHENQFWETLSAMTGDKSCDVTHFSKLNDFDLVQHAVLVSPDLQQVHVMFDTRQMWFCYTKLFKELESRTGLRLKHREKQVTTSSPKADSVTIVIFDKPDPVIDKKFVNAVDSTGTPDKGIIFLQSKVLETRPDWVDARLPTSTLMVYPEFNRERENQFWETLSAMLGYKSCDVTRLSKLNDFDLVQHAVLVSPDLQQVHVIFDSRQRRFCYTRLFKELESRTGLRLEEWEKQVTTSSATADSVTIVVFDDPDPVIDKKFVNAVGSPGTPDKGMIFLQNKVLDLRPDWVDARLPTSTLMVFPEFDRQHENQFWEILSAMTGHGCLPFSESRN